MLKYAKSHSVIRQPPNLSLFSSPVECRIRGFTVGCNCTRILMCVCTVYVYIFIYVCMCDRCAYVRMYTYSAILPLTWITRMSFVPPCTPPPRDFSKWSPVGIRTCIHKPAMFSCTSCLWCACLDSSVIFHATLLMCVHAYTTWGYPCLHVVSINPITCNKRENCACTNVQKPL
jgi:hypothetical protein